MAYLNKIVVHRSFVNGAKLHGNGTSVSHSLDNHTLQN